MRVWFLGVAFGLGGCFVQVQEPSDLGTHDPCDDVACSDNGYCEDGECYCNPFYVGNAYALHGCQPTDRVRTCETTCGINSYCDGDACVCADGFVAVCGTGDCMPLEQVCDGIADCVNERDEDPEVCEVAEVQSWVVTDDCVDGFDVAWKLWAQDRGWVWPSLDDAFMTEGVGVPSRASIECIRGETICLGAEVDGVRWGVGLDGTRDCDDCCHPCLPGVIDFGTLACE